MALDGLYDFEATAYGTTGWNGILQTNMEKVEDYMGSRIFTTLAEDVAQYKAVTYSGSGWVKALAVDGVPYPARGITIESGLNSQTKRSITFGSLTISGSGWTPGGKIYTSTSTAGELTQSIPVAGSIQILGYAMDADTMFVDIDISEDVTASGTYSLSGHTHTESDITDLQDYVTETEFTTHSGNLVSGYTAADAILDEKIDTTSGTLQTSLDSKVDSQAETFYIGNPTVSGSFRLDLVSGTLNLDKYNGATWINKDSWV